jgi:hypothetical protein
VGELLKAGIEVRDDVIAIPDFAVLPGGFQSC